MLQVRVRGQQFWVVLLTLTLVVVLAACAGATPAAQPAATEAPAPEAASEVEVAESSEEELAEDAAEETTEETTAESAEAPAAEAGEAPAEEAAAVSGTTTFVIDPAQSEARFTLTELLMGNPTTVIGRGNGVEGSVTVNFDDYSQSTVSPIVIDASTLETDNNMRNGQIRRNILQTNQPEFQYITFTPTAVAGLPESVTVGESFDLEVTGDLTIRTITQPMTFEVTVTPLSETELQGSARSTLLRSDFDLQIPRVPTVADVSEEVLLEFDFVAIAQ